MQRFYYLIVANSNVQASSKFFLVSVPETTQGERDRNFLQKWAADTQNYWSIRDNESSYFVARIAESLSTKIHLLPFGRITARCLVSYIKSNKDVPKSTEMTRSAGHLREILYPTSYFQRQINVLRKAEAGKRIKPKSIINGKMGRKNHLENVPSADGR